MLSCIVPLLNATITIVVFYADESCLRSTRTRSPCSRIPGVGLAGVWCNIINTTVYSTTYILSTRADGLSRSRCRGLSFSQEQKQQHT